MRIAGIDPGPVKSALSIIEDNKPVLNVWLPNDEILDYIRWEEYDAIGYEWVACYGRTVGEEVFRTAHMCGRIAEVKDPSAILYEQTRPDIILHLCGATNLPKSATRQALIDRWGGKEKTRKGQPLYKIVKHMWDSLAVCVHVAEINYARPRTYWSSD